MKTALKVTPLDVERQRLLAQLPDLSDMQVFGNRVLVAKFTRTTVGTSGRIIAADQTKTEDKWQGKIGLVIKVGAAAFRDEPGIEFYGDRVDVGDWIMFHYGDGWDLDIQGPTQKVACKLIKDVNIHGVVTRPDFIF